MRSELPLWLAEGRSPQGFEDAAIWTGRHRPVLAGVIFATAVLIGLRLGAAWLLVPRRYVSEADVRARLQRELPLGSSAREVSDVLSRQGIEHSALDYDSVGRRWQVNAVIHRSGWMPLFGEGSIYIVLFFDSRQRLTGYTVDEAYDTW